MSLSLKIIIGSTRPGRVGPTVANWVTRAAERHGGFDVELVDLADVGLPFLDEAKHPAQRAYEKEHTKAWSKIVDSADALVFVTPEYDFFPPATLVNALQCLSQEWKYKPAGVVCYGGISGGLRSAQELRQLIGNLGMVALPQVVPVPFVGKAIGPDGAFVPNDPMEEGAELMLKELTKWAIALLAMRGR
ncbi:NADPH-dependent FMN reductase [Albibacillus kandeliae]|uniref:NADPH-dependent FMN reductase n=1 Tax=Albibacillus kandeliae TaxID=2174228 RepID=UPI000D6999B9|nr:NADPH-dependent FMN reductase [Albibacillus kandeliae]